MAAAEQFLSAAPVVPDGETRDAVRLVLKLPSGERVERTFNAQDGAGDLGLCGDGEISVGLGTDIYIYICTYNDFIFMDN